MNSKLIIGIILVALGIFLLTGVSFRTQEKERVLQVGEFKVDAVVPKERSIPPIAGAIVLAGGVTLLVIGAKNRHA